MAQSNEGWRQSVTRAIEATTPIGSRIISRLSDAISGPPPAAAAGASRPQAVGSATLHEWHQPLVNDLRRPTRIGMALFLIFICGGSVWAATAPLASAVVARGLFVATGQNRIVQHLEGGIIRQILVQEGETVQAGQPLILLDDTAINAEVRRLEIKEATLLATKARIDAERLGATEIAYPDQIQSRISDAEVAKTVSAQNALFQSRMEEFEAQRQINERQIGAIEREIEGLNAQMASAREQLKLNGEELQGAEKLYGKGLIQLSQLLLLKRNRSKLEGDIGQFMSEIGRAEQRILGTRNELVHQRSKLVEEGADLYRQTIAELSDTQERLTAGREIFNRQTIRAPSRGVIVTMQHHTPGGVITPGQQVLELLPTDEKLIVEAYVHPNEINYVHVGLEAEMRLVSFNQRTTPLILGRVIYVSADKIQSNKQNALGEYYYIARIELNEAAAKQHLVDAKIAPGMPAEVYIKTGERTAFEYMLRPITDVMHRGGREQ